MRSQGRYDEFHIINSDTDVVIGTDVHPYVDDGAWRHLADVMAVVELMVAEGHDDLPVVGRSPVPERVSDITHLQVLDIAGQNENVARHLHGEQSQVVPVCDELQMEVTGILDSHFLRIFR